MGKKSKKKKAGGGAPASSVEPLAASITREQASFEGLAGGPGYSTMSEQDVQTCVHEVNARGAAHGIQPILDAPSKEEHKVNLTKRSSPNVSGRGVRFRTIRKSHLLHTSREDVSGRIAAMPSSANPQATHTDKARKKAAAPECDVCGAPSATKKWYARDDSLVRRRLITAVAPL